MLGSNVLKIDEIFNVFNEVQSQGFTKNIEDLTGIHNSTIDSDKLVAARFSCFNVI